MTRHWLKYLVVAMLMLVPVMVAAARHVADNAVVGVVLIGHVYHLVNSMGRNARIIPHLFPFSP